MSIQNIQVTEQTAPVKETRKALTLVWTLDSSVTEVVARYCSHCGKVVNFKDSGVRRQNANGKNIFHFAIYKCEKDHTWNKKLEQFTAKPHLTNVPIYLLEDEDAHSSNNYADSSSLNLEVIKSQGIEKIQIQVLIANGKHRLDKILSERLETISRSQLVKHIEAGDIALDGEMAKGKAFLKNQQVIEIDLGALNV